MSEPEIPDTMFLLFERGMFLGAFTEYEPAERLMNARIGKGKNGMEIGEYRAVWSTTSNMDDG